MEKDSKFMWAIGIATVAIIGAGAFFFTRTPSSTPKPSTKVNHQLLVKDNSNIDKAPNENVVLVEFGDFQCPACGTYYPLVKKLEGEFKNNLTFVFRNFPLAQHKNARAAAYAAEAAGKQGKYWEMFDKIYESQDKWSDAADAAAIFTDYAKSLSLDLQKYQNDVKSKEVKDKVDSDAADGAALGVNSTPTFYLNDEKLESPRSYEDFQTLVKAAMINSPVSNITGEEAYHAHFDMKVILSGKQIDFTQAKYQESKDNKLDEDVHFHDGNGKVVHLHKKGVTLAQFFKSLKMEFSKDCLNVDTGIKYCTGSGKTLRMYVNGKENTDFEKYVPQDLDRVLVTYGSETVTQIQKQIDSVSDDSCIYSEKCPERGKPPTEECVGGLGTGCSE